MTRRVLSRMVRIGRASVYGVCLSLILTGIFGTATIALAAVPGDPFKLGQINAIDALTTLAGGKTGPMLRIDNNGTGQALQLLVEPNRAPLVVNADAGKAVNLSADRLDGKDSTDFARAYGRTVVVGPVPGNAKAGGTGLRTALAGITDASENNPYLLKIEPGVYDLGTSNPLSMKPYVDVEGSGEGVTTIKCACPSDTTFNTGTVEGASNAELRFVTVENTGGGMASIAVFNNVAAPHLTHVTAAASGGIAFNLGVVNGDSQDKTEMSHVTATASGGNESMGVYNFFSSPRMSDVVAGASGGTATNRGVFNSSSSPKMTDVTAKASGGTESYGVYNHVSSPVILDSTLEADGAVGTNARNWALSSHNGGTVRVDGSRLIAPGDATGRTVHSGGGVTTRVGASRLDGGAVQNDGALACAGVYDEIYAFFASTCP